MKRLFGPARGAALLVVAIALAVALVAASACSTTQSTGTFTGGGSPTSTDATSTTSSSGHGGSGGGCVFGCGGKGMGGDITTGPGPGFVVVPSLAQLLVANGKAQTQQFKAYLNGTDVTSKVTWSFGRPDIGDLDKTFTFVPTGNAGGKAKLAAQLNKMEADADVTVMITRTLNSGNLTPAQIQAFTNPKGGPDPSMQIVYPYNDTVFPLGVVPPEIMWNGGSSGDVYRLTINETYFHLVDYLTAPAPADHVLADDDWKAIADSGVGPKTDPVGVSLTRQSNGTVYQAVNSIWHIAQGRLHGSVYYWQLPASGSNGQVLRIKPDSVMTDQFFPTQDCYGCHTVSRDGKTMFASFSVGFPFPQRTIDLTQNPAQLGSIQGQITGTFGAFNDKGDKLLVSNDDSGSNIKLLRIIDATTAAVLNPTPFYATGCGEPAWSPDGKHVAAICNLNSAGWIFDSTHGDLTVGDVAADGVTITNVHTIVPSGMGQGRAAYPSFAPGSDYIYFGRPTQGSRSDGKGQLWLVKRDGSELKHLGTAENYLNNSYNGVFAPLRAGGYFWLVFSSRRDYGNHANLVGMNRQQLWIAAIEDPPTNSPDPSQPAFYVRGQDDMQLSENAYYALDPCKDLGQDCTTGVDCCGGQCIKDPMTMKYVCGTPPPPGMCSENGNSCMTKADCCDPTSECIDGFCQYVPPK